MSMRVRRRFNWYPLLKNMCRGILVLSQFWRAFLFEACQPFQSCWAQVPALSIHTRGHGRKQGSLSTVSQGSSLAAFLHARNAPGGHVSPMFLPRAAAGRLLEGQKLQAMPFLQPGRDETPKARATTASKKEQAGAEHAWWRHGRRCCHGRHSRHAKQRRHGRCRLVNVDVRTHRRPLCKVLCSSEG